MSNIKQPYKHNKHTNPVVWAVAFFGLIILLALFLFHLFDINDIDLDPITAAKYTNTIESEDTLGEISFITTEKELNPIISIEAYKATSTVESLYIDSSKLTIPYQTEYSLQFYGSKGYVTIYPDGRVKTNIQNLGDLGKTFWCAVMLTTPYLSNTSEIIETEEWNKLECNNYILSSNYLD